VLNQIETHEFLYLKGDVIPPHEHHKGKGPLHRMGVDGSAFASIGRWGDPFQLESFVDQSSIDEAWVTFHKYVELISAGCVPLIQDDHDFTTDGWEIKVVGVAKIEVRQQICFSGGLNLDDGENGASLRCRWTVCAVELLQ